MFSPTLKKKFLWHPGYESSNFPQNFTNARVLFSTSIDHCLDHFESLEFAQAQLREKSHFTSLFSSQSAVFALCRRTDGRPHDDVLVTMVLRASGAYQSRTQSPLAFLSAGERQDNGLHFPRKRGFRSSCAYLSLNRNRKQ